MQPVEGTAISRLRMALLPKSGRENRGRQIAKMERGEIAHGCQPDLILAPMALADLSTCDCCFQLHLRFKLRQR